MTYTGLDPLRVPDDFWTREDVIYALRQQDFTRLFLLLRKYAQGSQTKIAAACALTQSTVSKIMLSKHQPTAYDVIRRIADGLNMPDHARLHLGLAPVKAARSTPHPAPTSVPATNTSVPGTNTSEPGPDGQPRTLLEQLIRQRSQTYEEAAAELGISPRHLARLARRERDSGAADLHPATRRSLQAMFHLPVEHLLLPPRDTPTGVSAHVDRPTATADHTLALQSLDRFQAVNQGDPLATLVVDDSRLWVPSQTVEMASRFTRGDLSLDRRDALRTIAGILFGPMLLELLEPWLSEGDQPVVDRRAAGVGYDEIEQIENAARLFRSWDNQFGGGLRRKAVVGQLSEIADELRDHFHSEPLRRRLFGAMSQLAETAAIMSWDSGRDALAQRYYVIALRAAKESGDRAFGANILAGMARQLLYLGRTAEALELIRLAQAGADGHATPAVRAMLHTREAWAYANQGRIGAFQRATNNAQDAFTNVRRDDEPYWILYFDEAELAGVTGGRLLDLAHRGHARGHVPANDAAEQIERAIQLRPQQSLRSSALDRVGIAETRLIQGEAEESSRLAHQAVDIITKTHSDRARIKLAEFYRHTDRYAAIPMIAQMRDRVRGLLQPQSHQQE